MGSRLTNSRHPILDAPESDPDQLDLGVCAAPRVIDARAADDVRRAREMPRSRLAETASARPLLLALTLVAALAVTAAPAWAAGAGTPMPWDGPLLALVNNLTGTTARALVLLAVVGAGLLWAFTRNEEGLKKLGQITFGGAIALGAATLMASLGFAGATF
jgi:type IV secretion system protein VirB2